MYQTSEKPTVRIAEFSAQWEGRTIDGAYPLRQFLGSGENSAVFLTTHDGRNAAIKLLPADPVGADAQLLRWREAAKLSHLNLLRILSTGRTELDGHPLLYIVMERAEEDLSQVLPDRSLTAVEAREMLEPTLTVLEYIHRQGFVHDHLKPSNIMAVEDRLKISSDGLLRAGTKDPRASTPYDPPERAAEAVAPSGDVWSLGVTLVEILTQRLPSNGTVPADLPEPFSGIARACLQRNSASRSTIPQISSLLTQRELPPPPRKRRYTPVGVIVLLVLVVIIIAGVMIMHSDTSTPVAAKPAETVKAPEPQAPPPAAPKQEPVQTAKAIKPPEPEKKSEPAPEPKQPAATPEPVSSAPVSGILEQPLPEITDKASSTIHGKVRFNVRVDVGPSGAVTDAKLDSSASKYFGERALAAVRQWKFEPVTVNGSQVGQRWRVRFEFLKTGVKVQPQRLSP
jgi:TonB family protein